MPSKICDFMVLILNLNLILYLIKELKKKHINYIRIIRCYFFKKRTEVGTVNVLATLFL